MKKKKLIKKIVILCIAIILIELIAMLIMKIVRERKIDHFDVLNDIIEVDDYYIGVGTSDFDDSKFIDKKYYIYTDSASKEQKIIANQAKIVKYDKDKNILWESTFDGEYDSSFNSVIKVDDGLIAVGSYVSKQKQIDAHTTDALIVKYDLNGKMLWYKDYTVLSNTKFNKIIDDGNDNYIVVGQSIYENMEMGSHIIGGGIILRYDKDGNLLAHNNYGGNKSGSFNDVIKVDDGYIVCGKDAVNYGIVIKFKKDFNRDDTDTNLITKKVVWNKTYSNTDEIGFTSMIKVDDKIYTVGAINVSKEKDEEGKQIYKYDAGIVLYSTSGKYLGKYSMEEDVHHRFNSVIKLDNELLLTANMNVDNQDDKKDSMIVKFNLNDNKFIDKVTKSEKDDYVILKIADLSKKTIIGTSKSKCSLYGCEYQSFVEEYK